VKVEKSEEEEELFSDIKDSSILLMGVFTNIIIDE
jgi:hypothetical protein